MLPGMIYDEDKRLRVLLHVISSNAESLPLVMDFN